MTRARGLNLRQRWAAWWDARLPRRDTLTLTQRNLYILPSRTGWWFGAVVMVLLLASINEQVNLGYALAFLLAGVALASIHQTHANLQGLSLHLQGMHSVHAGNALPLTIALRNKHRRRARLGIQIKAQADASLWTDVAPGDEVMVELSITATQRGWLELPRLTVDTQYPMGFFRVWAYWKPQRQALIWPAVDPLAPPLPEQDMDTPSPVPTKQAQSHQGSDSAEGLRPYRRGDPLRMIAWKKSSRAWAAGQDPIAREPMSSHPAERWLDFDRSQGLQGLSTEARLSRLAAWLVQAQTLADAQGPLYGLKLPGVTLPCSAGPAHLKACMNALAIWPSVLSHTTSP
jgi:uncharacterized protein (DUF58 family)